MEVKNVRLPCKEVVTNTQALHCVHDTFDIPGCHVVSQYRRRIVTFLQRMQDIIAEFDSFWIQFSGWLSVAIEQPNLRVEVPAIVIKWTLRRQRCIESLNLIEVHFLDVHEAYNNVGNLNARIVN